MRKTLIACLVITLLNTIWLISMAVDTRLSFGNAASPFYKACVSESLLPTISRDVAKQVGAEILGAGNSESHQSRYAGARIIARIPVKIAADNCERFVEDLFNRLDAELKARGCSILDRHQSDHARGWVRIMDYNTRWCEGDIAVVPVVGQDGTLIVGLTVHEYRAKRLIFL